MVLRLLTIFLLFSFAAPVDAGPKFSRRTKICAAVAVATASVFAYQYGPQAATITQNRAPWNPQWNGYRTIDWGRLTPFWGQEEIGADLAKNFVEEHPPLIRVPFAVLNSAFEPDLIPKKQVAVGRVFLMQDPANIPDAMKCHGTGCLNLMIGNGPVGSTNIGYLKVAMVLPNYAEFSGDTQLDNFADATVKIIHVGIRGFSNLGLEKLNALHEQGKILIVGAGNEPGRERCADIICVANKSQQEIPGILIGSLNPDGSLSSGNVPGKIKFFAPGGNFLQTIAHLKNWGGPLTTIGMTSGASSLATGSAINVLSYLPNLTQDELEILMMNSAIPLQTTEGRPIYMINAYRMVQAAYRFSRMNFEGRDAANRRELLSMASMYQFPNEEEKLLSEGSADSLRAAFLLNPRAETAAKLENFYRKNGLTSNASFYSKFK